MFKNIVAAKVLAVEKHPNADRLRVVSLDIGGQTVEPVVCGAFNFESGDMVVLALPGAQIPHKMHSLEHEPFILEKAKIRGIESQGMLCAASELGLSDELDRVILLLKDDVTPGSQFTENMIKSKGMAQRIVINFNEENRLKKELEKRTDFEAARMRRYLAMPDLSRTEGSPIYEIVQRILAHPYFKNLDIIQTPEIVPASISFDLFDFPPDHPARSKSDTYYVDDQNILRTHTTVMWYYYLQDPGIKQRLAKNEPVGSFSFGKVYRKDEIDRKHMNVFHQIDGWYLAPKTLKTITQTDLEEALGNIAKAVFGPDIKYRLNKDTFPYTNPSLEMEVDLNGNWVEVVGCGVVKDSVLEKLGVDSGTYTGWAFGFGLERLAIASMELPDIRLLWSDDERVKKQLHLGQKFVEVSKFPPITRDISFVVDKSFFPNDYFDLIRHIGGDLVEQVELLDKYENETKFGKNKISYTYRVVYRSGERTLKSEEVDPLQDKLYTETKDRFNAQLR
jgi:phenylalanyl-tRNA synthetase alpha chain